jgi:outer membrane protein, heavy metal efflux system
MVNLRTIVWGISGCVCLLGCRTAPPGHAPRISQTSQLSVPPEQQVPSHKGGLTSDFQVVSFQEPSGSEKLTAVPESDAKSTTDVFALEQFVAEVRERHPSAQAMRAAWQAAAQRYPQVVALDDPMFMAMTAPGSLVSSSVAEGAYALQLNQKITGYGKRMAKGTQAMQEAAAAGHDIQDIQLQLDLIATNAFLDYYQADQQLSLNQENRRLAKEFLATAQSKYQTNQVTQQDVLQAEVELAEFERRSLELSRMRRTATARINILLLRSPESPLAVPAAIASIAPQETDSVLLQELAMQQRPDLAALRHRVEAEQAALDLAIRQYRPDVDVFGRYDTFWQPSDTQGDLRAQVGASVNLPVYRRKLNAAVCEAEFRVRQRRAEYQQRLLEVQYDVQAALERIDEGQQVLKLYTEKLLPAARQNVEAAQSNYGVGKGTFQELVQSQRQLVMVRDKWLEAQVEYARQRSELQRAIGGAETLR